MKAHLRKANAIFFSLSFENEIKNESDIQPRAFLLRALRDLKRHRLAGR